MKPVSTWAAIESARESRSACGGLGYSFYSRFGELIATSEVNQTWEGENYVMIQQAIRYILKNYSNLMQGKNTMKTLEFMDLDLEEEYKFEGSLNSLNDLEKLLAYNANKLVHESINRIQEETMKEEGEALSKSDIWEKHLFYTFIPMAKAYCEHFTLTCYIKFLEKLDDSPKSRLVFEKLALLHLHNLIINEGSYREIFSSEQIDELRESCIQLNKELRPEMVALTYTMSFTDYDVGAIGQSNLQSYTNFMNDVKNTPGCFDKPKEWKFLYENNSV